MIAGINGSRLQRLLVEKYRQMSALPLHRAADIGEYVLIIKEKVDYC